MNTFIYETSIVDPYYNLAVEDSLCRYVSSATVRGEKLCGLFLWQSDKVVVIGRNQNPAYECDMSVLKKNQVKLARRLTGGGAVYQDLGNLNYSFISSDDETAVEDHLEIVLRTLKRFGINANCSGRNDIVTLQNRKVSGTAQKRYKDAFLLHGTLLVDLDKEMAEQCLTPNQFKLASKSIRSVSARIVNISDIIGRCTVHDIRECMKEEFWSEYAKTEHIEPILSESDIEENCRRLSDHEWIMGSELSDYWIVQKQWGTVRFSILEGGGCIRSVKYETDCIEVDFIALFFDGMKGMKLDRKNLLQYLTVVRKENLSHKQCIQMAADLIEKIVSELQ